MECGNSGSHYGPSPRFDRLYLLLATKNGSLQANTVINAEGSVRWSSGGSSSGCGGHGDLVKFGFIFGVQKLLPPSWFQKSLHNRKQYVKCAAFFFVFCASRLAVCRCSTVCVGFAERNVRSPDAKVLSPESLTSHTVW